MHKVKVIVRNKNRMDRLLVKPTESTRMLINGNTLEGVRPVFRTNIYEEPVIQSEICIPEKIKVISNGAFAEWEALQHVRFEHTAYNLGAGVFSDCSALETVILAKGTEKIPLECFKNCRSLRSVKIPATVKRINMNSLRNCSALAEIKLPSGLQEIEIGAFYGCHALEEIRIPDSVMAIGDEAFANCTKLKKIYLPESLQEIGDLAFMNCVSLETVVIPPPVKFIPMGAFAGCKKLKQVILHKDIEYIHPYAFYGCDNAEFVGPFEIRKPTLPMELLYKVSGEISGAMLTAMGYPWFDTERNYRIYRTENDGVLEVHAAYNDTNPLLTAEFDCIFMNESLEPISAVPPLTFNPHEERYAVK